MATRNSRKHTANHTATFCALTCALAGLLGFSPSLAFAQAGGSADIELGATQASSYDSSSSSSSPAASSYRSSSSVRLALQIRLDALTMVGAYDDAPIPGGATIGRRLLVPVAAPGVRILDDKLFIGAGLSFYGWSQEQPNGDESSRSGFGLHPLASFDVMRESAAALSLNAALNIASLGETENCGGPMGCVDANDDSFGLGLTVGAGIRGLIGPGLAIGGDFGWGFLSSSSDNDQSVFVHGLYAALLFEASVGL